jgi:hypothetical protein
MTVTIEQLEAARAAVEQAHGPYDRALKARQALILEAVQGDMRPATAARHAGISRQAVAKLAESAPNPENTGAQEPSAATG